MYACDVPGSTQVRSGTNFKDCSGARARDTVARACDTSVRARTHTAAAAAAATPAGRRSRALVSDFVKPSTSPANAGDEEV
eukprot:6056020-Prymnesium_polylepis.1